MPNNERASIYARITDQIIAAIERGVETKRMPWHHDGSAVYRQTNAVTKKQYRGINTLALWASAEAKAYPTGLWGAFKQWAELGAVVRKGERASAIVLWKQVQQPDAEDSDKKRFFARGYSVFSARQWKGARPKRSRRCRRRSAWSASKSCMMAIWPIIGLQPTPERFVDAASFYGVSLHELGHASGAQHRLNRDLSGRFGSVRYAAEECCVDFQRVCPCRSRHRPQSARRSRRLRAELARSIEI